MTGMRLQLPRGTLAMVVKDPRLIRAAWYEARVMRPTRWWRRRPFLPLPDARYWRFRLETAYGGLGDTQPSSDEIHEVLTWAQVMRRFER